MNSSIMQISESVQAALAQKTPVLALESTVITHGMPYPQNVQTALELENEARLLGVEPATICVMNGKVRIGISESELHELANATEKVKLSIRDIPYALSKQLYGGTTVAATMYLAHQAGIKVFTTGGIGGVHRLAEQTFDVSADLPALANIPVIVVCAGAKLILDLPKTLEYLETLSVPVYGFQTDTLPAFYTRQSPYPVSRIDSASQIAQIFYLQQQCNMKHGMLIANPIPASQEIAYPEIEEIIERALAEAAVLQITGKATTPFLLQKLYELSDGKTLDANIALIKNNVRLGAKIAWAVTKQEN
jgi:pseudouridine-5'-phosphate glycosidase